MNKAIFLDRDGTIIKDRNYLSDPNKIHIYKGVIPALKKLKKQGWKLIIGTNQAGIARGFLSLETLQEIHRRLFQLFKKQNLIMDDIFFCPHHPDERCQCRKPNVGMLMQAQKKHHLDLKQCIVIGDNESDIQWGINGGMKTILVLTGYGKKTLMKGKIKPDCVVRSLPYAVKWILKNK